MWTIFGVNKTKTRMLVIAQMVQVKDFASCFLFSLETQHTIGLETNFVLLIIINIINYETEKCNNGTN